MRTKKEVSGPSITEAVCDVLEFGTPRNKQVAETHFELLRQVQGDPLRSSFAVRGGKNLCLPFSAFCRQLAVGTPARGLPACPQYRTHLKQLESVKHLLWHGDAEEATV